MASDSHEVDEERAQDLGKILQTYNQEEILAAIQYGAADGGTGAGAVLHLAAIGDCWTRIFHPLEQIEEFTKSVDEAGYIRTAQWLRERHCLAPMTLAEVKRRGGLRAEERPSEQEAQPEQTDLERLEKQLRPEAERIAAERSAALALRPLPGVAAVVRALQLARPGLVRDLLEYEGHREGRYKLLSLAGDLPQREAALNALAAQGYRVEYLIRGASTALLERHALPQPPAAEGSR